jgi:coenzyme F420-reducing hydrogenase beta subunit
MIENKTYAVVPRIDETLCVDCGLCRERCPQNQKTEMYEPYAVYAVWAKDKNEQLSSSSGGVASVFYKCFINNFSGVCVGASFSENLLLCHKISNKLEIINEFKGSKYVQSFIGDVYTQIKDYIKNKVYVLFVGTPCQVDGLINFLGEDSEYLFTVDLICHGTPPVSYLQSHLKRHLTADPKMSVVFRDNTHFRVTVSPYSGKNIKKFHDVYLYAFLSGLIYRENCYTCKYAQAKRVADITIGDFWGVSDEIASLEDAHDGCSVVLINTDKGDVLFNSCKNDITFYERTLDEAKKDNEQLNHPSIRRKEREKFLKYLNIFGFNFACHWALFPRFHLAGVKLLVKSFIPAELKKVLKHWVLMENAKNS